MKYIILSLIVMVAVVLGFFLGRYSVINRAADKSLADRPILRDTTIIREKTIKIIQPIKEVREKVVDTASILNKAINDTLNSKIEQDSIDDVLSISREILLETKNTPITYLNQQKVNGDSTLREKLGINQIKHKFITIEYWKSPLNFEGYRLSAGKLILYGVPTEFGFDFVRNGEEIFLVSEEISYKLIESDEFQPLMEVSISQVYAD